MNDANFYANLIANAPIQSSSRYFEAGVYHVQIDGAKIFLNRQRRPRAAVECTVVDSSNPSFPVTSQVSWIVSLDNDSGPSTIRTFIVDITGCTHEQAGTLEAINKFFPNVDADPNAGPSVATGLHALVNAFEKPTQSGGVYTRCSWRRFDPETDTAPDFAALRASAQAPASNNSAPAVDAAPAGQVNGSPIPF